MTSFTKRLRSVARGVSNALEGHPRLHRFLTGWFLRLPQAVRGRQLIHDHLRELSRERRDRTFCLVGANDGVSNDHLYPFAKRFRWKGVLVEPVPSCFARLRENYRGLPVTLENVAIHRQERSMTLYSLDEGKAKLPPWARGVSSFDRSNLEKFLRPPVSEDAIVPVEVPCRRLEEVVEQSGLSSIDIVVIDAEGYDAEIIRQVRFDDWGVTTVIFEHQLLKAEELKECFFLLEEKGFRWEKDEWDVLATR